MITEKDLQEAIAECEGQRNPNANTCIKLAAYYTIRQYMFGGEPEGYSYATGPSNPPLAVSAYESDTEFGKLASKSNMHAVMGVMDELMTALSVINPRLYSGTLRKLEDVTI